MGCTNGGHLSTTILHFKSLSQRRGRGAGRRQNHFIIFIYHGAKLLLILFCFQYRLKAKCLLVGLLETFIFRLFSDCHQYCARRRFVLSTYPRLQDGYDGEERRMMN
ncbi:unnamed protein product [Mortierella alpina]